MAEQCSRDEVPPAKRLKYEPWSLSTHLLSGRIISLVLPEGPAATIEQLLHTFLHAAKIDGRVKLVHENNELSDPQQRLDEAGLQDGSQINVLCLPDRRLATADDSGQTVRFWNVDKAQKERTLWIDEEGGSESESVETAALRCGSVGISPKLDFVVACPTVPSLDCRNQYRMKIWGSGVGWHFLALAGHQGSPWSVAVSREGVVAITCSRDGIAQLWCTSTGRCLATLEGFNRLIPTVSIQHCKAAVAVTRSWNGRSVYLWGEGGPAEVVQSSTSLAGHQTPVIVLAAAGKHIATCTQNGTATLWDPTTGGKRRSFEGRDCAQITCVAFSPSGDILATGDSHGSAVLWEIASGQAKLTLEPPTFEEGKEDEVRCIAFSPDSHLVALGFVWGPTRVWNLEHGQCVELARLDCSDGVIVFEDSEVR